eukprot:TRINITY_DN11742_c0_g2_i1.p4 TRINITY_DN11742_c0_g2~~TRINITY_DN11742_c0_g2_i1.p4  ORF type:complete len:238 (-),score=-9.78 TRINITY_DN11742_c0_g2_i1:178-891(-)
MLIKTIIFKYGYLQYFLQVKTQFYKYRKNTEKLYKKMVCTIYAFVLWIACQNLILQIQKKYGKIIQKNGMYYICVCTLDRVLKLNSINIEKIRKNYIKKWYVLYMRLYFGSRVKTQFYKYRKNTEKLYKKMVCTIYAFVLWIACQTWRSRGFIFFLVNQQIIVFLLILKVFCSLKNYTSKETSYVIFAALNDDQNFKIQKNFERKSLWRLLFEFCMYIVAPMFIMIKVLNGRVGWGC